MNTLQDVVLLVVVAAFGIACCILLYVRHLKSTDRDSPKLRAIGLVLICYSIAIWTMIYLVLVPYTNAMAPTISRHYTFVPLTQTGAHFSLFFHAGLSIFLIASSTWFGLRLWRQGSEP